MAPLSQTSARAIARLRAYRAPSPSTYSALPVSRRSAVLLLLFSDLQGDLRVVLTLRSTNMSSYSGQVSFPGGKADYESETPFQTARREAEEEIGLPREKLPHPYQVEHLCELPAHLAVTELGVRPCVAYLHTGEVQGKAANIEENMIPRLNAKEVAAIFSAPFHRFLSDGRDDPAPTDGSPKKQWYQGIWNKWNNDNWRMHNFYIPRNDQLTGPRVETSPGAPDEDTYRVFGLTAAMLVGAARIAYDEQPQFEYKEEVGEELMISKLIEMGRLKDKKVKGSMLSKEDFQAASKRAKENL